MTILLSPVLWLFDASGFTTRSHCGIWTPGLSWVYQASSLVIALSYFFIPACILSFWRRKRMQVQKPWILVCFAAFIVLCGFTHVADFTVFYWAGYRFYTALMAITAIVSAATAYLLVGVVRYAIRLPSREDVHRLNNELQAEVLLRQEAELRLLDKSRELERQLLDLQGIIARRDRHDRQDAMIEKTREILESVREDAR